jgi:asparagine synthase (glutamine-hydrolysing)
MDYTFSMNLEAQTESTQLPGIVVSVGATNPLQWTSLDSGRQSFYSEKFEAPFVRGVMRALNRTWISGVVSNETGYGIAIDASPNLMHGSDQATLDRLLNAYERQGPSFIRDLDGQFFLVAWDEKQGEVLVANDRYGHRPYFMKGSGSGWIIGPSAEEISALEGEPLRIDERMIYSQLSYSRVAPPGLTWFQNYTTMPPATCLTWSKNLSQFRSNTYWDYFGNQLEPSRNSHDLIHEISIALKISIERCLGLSSNVALSLSGGLDSRILLATLPAENRHQVRAYTWGHSRNSVEVQIARDVASETGIRWNYLPLTPRDFVSDLSARSRLIQGRDNPIQGYALDIFRRVSQECNIAMSGLSFDVLASGSYQSKYQNTFQDVQNFGSIQNLVLNDLKLFQFDKEMFFKTNDARDHVFEIERLLKEEFKETSTDPGNSIDRFILRQRVAGVIFPRQMWQRMHLEDVSPTFSNHLINCLTQLSSKSRSKFALSRAMLMHISPRLANIPYQRTMLPVTVPVEFWAESLVIEKTKEDLYRRIFLASDGGVHVPYQRYYSNFDEWQRIDPYWTEVINFFLLSADTRLTQEYVDRSWIKNLVDRQRRGMDSNFAKINVLLGVETMLRNFPQ